MGAVLSSNFSHELMSYQHIHGIMLFNLNKIAFERNLSNYEYRLLGVLITYWNKKQEKAFPTFDLLAKTCKMSKSTVVKTLDFLADKKLLVITKQKGSRNNYFFSSILFLNPGTHCKTKPSTSCKTSNINRTNELES
ncbi:MAG: helix-turn-helix domain-containing protein [Cyanobacteriota bacterium]